jgi:hypothetical protein
MQLCWREPTSDVAGSWLRVPLHAAGRNPPQLGCAALGAKLLKDSIYRQWKMKSLTITSQPQGNVRKNTIAWSATKMYGTPRSMWLIGR